MISRAPRMQRSKRAISRSPLRIGPNEFVAGGAGDHIGVRRLARVFALSRHDLSAISKRRSVDHRKIIDRRHDIGAGAPFAGERRMTREALSRSRVRLNARQFIRVAR